MNRNKNKPLADQPVKSRRRKPQATEVIAILQGIKSTLKCAITMWQNGAGGLEMAANWCRVVQRSGARPHRAGT
jgi:hypothetical protein